MNERFKVDDLVSVYGFNVGVAGITGFVWRGSSLPCVSFRWMAGWEWDEAGKSVGQAGNLMNK